MNRALHIREALKSELPDVLHLYAQPDLDNGKVLPIPDAERIFDRMAQYPNYRIYVAISDTRVVAVEGVRLKGVGPS